MTIITKKDFLRVHNNGSILVEVPAGTALKLQDHGYGAWTVKADKPVTKDKSKVFRVSRYEYNQLLGA